MKDVDALAVRSYLASLRKEGLKKSSAGRHLSALRTFFAWLKREGKVSLNPARAIATPKADVALPRTLSVDEAALVVEARTGDDALSTRDRALLELLYATGLRVGELVALDPPGRGPFLRASSARSKGARKGSRLRSARGTALPRLARAPRHGRAEGRAARPGRGRLPERDGHTPHRPGVRRISTGRSGGPPSRGMSRRSAPALPSRRISFQAGRTSARSRSSATRRSRPRRIYAPRRADRLIEVYRKSHPKATAGD